jgi:hypothetical protein
MFTWWQRYCVERSQRQLAVVVARDGDGVVAILPGYVKTRFGIATWCFLGTEFESTDYLRVIESNTANASHLPGLLAALTGAVPVDVIELGNVLATDTFVHDVEGYAGGGEDAVRGSAASRLSVHRRARHRQL